MIIINAILFVLALLLAVNYRRWFVHAYKIGKEEPGKTLIYGWGAWLGLSIVSGLAFFSSNKTMAAVGLVVLYAPPLVLGTVAGCSIIASYVGFEPEKNLVMSVLVVGGVILVGTIFVPVMSLAYKGIYYFGLGAVILALQSEMPEEAPPPLPADNGEAPVFVPGRSLPDLTSEPPAPGRKLKLALLSGAGLLACGLFALYVYPLPQLAFSRLTKGCAAGSGENCRDAGTLLEKGYRIKKDKALAAQYYRKACGLGDKPACSEAAALRAQGFSGYAPGAVSAAETRCAGGDAEACATAGMDCYKGTGRERDVLKAADLFRKACDQGSNAGCHGLAWLRSKGDEFHAPNPAFGATLYQKACEGGYTPSCYNLALAYQKGDGVERDLAAALELAESACAKNHPQACDLARALERE